MGSENLLSHLCDVFTPVLRSTFKRLAYLGPMNESSQDHESGIRIGLSWLVPHVDRTLQKIDSRVDGSFIHE